MNSLVYLFLTALPWGDIVGNNSGIPMNLPSKGEDDGVVVGFGLPACSYASVNLGDNIIATPFLGPPLLSRQLGIHRLAKGLKLNLGKKDSASALNGDGVWGAGPMRFAAGFLTVTSSRASAEVGGSANTGEASAVSADVYIGQRGHGHGWGVGGCFNLS
eukprot:scaffold50918_cov63-Cyclotella_meneghiniana.AAC.1